MCFGGSGAKHQVEGLPSVFQQIEGLWRGIEYLREVGESQDKQISYLYEQNIELKEEYERLRASIREHMVEISNRVSTLENQVDQITMQMSHLRLK